jgi:AI-2 transport protein TqsA
MASEPEEFEELWPLTAVSSRSLTSYVRALRAGLARVAAPAGGGGEGGRRRMELRASIGDPLGQESPRPGAAAYQAPRVEDDPEEGGSAAFSGAHASFEQEPRGAPPSSRDSGAWSSTNPVAWANTQQRHVGASTECFVGAAESGGDSAPPPGRDRFDVRSRSVGSLGSDGRELGSPDGVGVAPTLGSNRPGQSPDYGSALDRSVAQQQSGVSRHLRGGANAGNYLESSLFASEGEVSPRSRGIGDLARAASNSNGFVWRSGSRPQDALTATEVLAAQAEAAGDLEHGGSGTSPLRSWSAAAASVFGVANPPGPEDARRSVHWADAPGDGRLGQDSGGVSGHRSGLSGIGENCLVIMTMVTMGCVLYVLQQVLVPLLLAVFVSAMLLPMLDFVTERPFHLFGRVWLRDTCGLCLKVEQRYDNWLGHLLSSILTFRLPNVIGLLVVLGVLVILGFGLGVLVYSSVETFWHKSDYYEEEIFNLTKAMPGWVINHVGSSGQAALSKDQLFGTLTDSAAASEVVIDILLESEHLLATTALTFLYTIFILLGRQDRTAREANRTLVVIEDQLQVYLSWKFLVSAVSGTVIGVTLGQLGIDLAAVFGILTFFLNFIPTVGLLVAVVLPIPLIYISPVPATNKFLAIVIPYGTQVIVTNFIEPLVFGRRLHLHPIFVLFSLVFWNMLWGLTGAVLSIPIM